MIPADRLEELCRDLALGKSRSDSVQSSEEGKAWDEMVPQVAAIREGGQVDLPWDPPGFDYLETLYP